MRIPPSARRWTLSRATPNWFTRIEEWSEPVAVNDLKGSGTFIGACAVQGRKIYAHKVTKAQTVLVKSHA